MPIGKNVVIIGGGIHGLQIATFLIKRGRKVTIVDKDEEMGKGIVLTYKFRVFYWLEQKKVPLYSGVKYEGITDKGLTITTKAGEKKTLAADAIIPALPMAPDTELVKSLQGTAPEIYQIGDCGDPALIVDAIADGFRIGRTI
jgi:2,4-dienoyl-CoA reductase (NADPH2)